MISRLKEYIEKDEIYQDYKKGKLANASDFDNFCIQHCKDIEELLEENEELKKQLEHCYCNRTDCSSRIKDSKQYDSLVQKVENQQQEFIKYLKSINSFETIGNILNKYKEIIGDKNDNTK